MKDFFKDKTRYKLQKARQQKAHNNEYGVVFDKPRDEMHARHTEAVYRANGTVQKPAVDELAVLIRGEAHFAAPPQKCEYQKVNTKFVHVFRPFADSYRLLRFYFIFFNKLCQDKMKKFVFY